VIVLGDESGYTDGEVQKAKLAAIEAEWHTEAPPASFTVIGIPNQETMTTDYAIKIPWVLGLIGTRSFNEPITGLSEILDKNRVRVRDGMKAYGLLQTLRAGDKNPATIAEFNRYKKDLGYGMLLKRYTEKVVDATDAQIELAAQYSIPRVVPLFWTFRIMVGCGFIMLGVFIWAIFASSQRKFQQTHLLKWSLYTLPLPWIACEMGWLVAELGRQPWTIAEILPTFLSTSSLSEWDLYISLSGFIAIYTTFLAIEMFLMLKFIKLGPSSLHKGRYHFEIAEQVEEVSHV
jgi:cytochrome d ubiquinol oxidase subunit I